MEKRIFTNPDYYEHTITLVKQERKPDMPYCPCSAEFLGVIIRTWRSERAAVNCLLRNGYVEQTS